MKRLGLLILFGGFAWAAILVASERPTDPVDGPIALLLGVGMGLLTLAAVRDGTIRGANQTIRREIQPLAFAVAVAFYAAASLSLMIGGIIMW